MLKKKVELKIYGLAESRLFPVRSVHWRIEKGEKAIHKRKIIRNREKHTTPVRNKLTLDQSHTQQIVFIFITPVINRHRQPKP